MKTLNLIVGLSLGLTLTGCPSDDTGDEGAATTTTTSTTMTPTTSGEDDTTVGPPGTTTGDPPDPTTGDPPDPTTGDPDTSTGDDTTTGDAALSFAEDVYPIINEFCSCHVGGSPGMLAMPNADTAYGNLVNVPSNSGANNDDRVTPGDPDASFLWAKVTGTQGGAGGPMPPAGNPQPDQADLDIIEQWILDGAQP